MNRKLLAGVAVVGALVLANGCGDNNCIVTSNGNELCGDAAKAWCELNAGTRNDLSQSGYLDATGRRMLEETESACDQVGA